MQARQRGAGPVEPPAHLPLDPAGEGVVLLGGRQVVEVLDGDRDVGRTVHELQRLAEAGQVEGRAQDRVPHGEPPRGRFQPVAQERGADLDAADVDDVVGAVLAVEDEPLLEPRQWIGVLQVRGQALPVLGRDEVERPRPEVRGHVRQGTGQRGGEIADRLVREDLLQRDVEAPRARPHPHLETANRVAPQGEEVVVDTHPLQSEHLGPDTGQGPLVGSARRPVALLEVGAGALRRRQGAPVDLAGRPQRQRFEKHERPRHHVVGQALHKEDAQPVDGRRIFRPGDDVGHQSSLSGRLRPRHHRCLTHAGAAGQDRLDLARLDPEPADLHLVVGPPPILDLPVRPLARQVARAVEAGPGTLAVRIGNETLGGQIRPAPIAARQSGAADEQFPGDAERNRLHVPVEDMHAQIGDRPADRARGAFEVRDPQRPAGDVHRRLGDAVHVHQDRPLVTVPLEPRPQGWRLERLTPEKDETQRQVRVRRPGRRGRLGVHQEAEGGRRLVQDGDALPTQQAEELLGRAADQERDDHQPPAVQERAPHLPDGEVEGVRVEQRPDVLRAEVEPGTCRLEQPRDVPVRHHHPLRPSGRAGGVDDVRRMVRERVGVEVFGTRRVGSRAGRIEIEPLDVDQLHAASRGRRRQRPAQAVAGQDDARLRVLEDECQTIARIGRVERDVRPARLQDAKDRHDQVRRPIQADADHSLGAHAAGAEETGHPVGAVVQRSVAQALALERQRGGVPEAPDLPLEHLVQAGRPGQTGRGLAGRSPEGEPLPSLVRGQQRQLGKTAVGGGDRALEQGAEVADESFDGRGVEEIGAVLDRTGEAFIGLLGLQGEVKLGRPRVEIHALDRKARQAQIGTRHVLHDQGDLEEGLPRQVALHGQKLDEPVERQVLMGLRSKHDLARAAHDLAERRVAGQVAAQDESVDEAADQPLDLETAATGHRRPDAQVVLPAVAAQERLEGRQNRHEQSRPFPPAEGRDLLAESPR